MADMNKLQELIKGLAGEGVELADLMKAIKTAKDEGIIKSKGRGKLPSDDPLRLAVRDALLSLAVANSDKSINGKLIDLLATATAPEKDGEAPATSFMVTLNDNWKVNFIKSMPKEKKEKQAKKETKPSDFSEPAVV